ncbi:MAG: putative Mg2+ transporter-C (MgtC) family protein [Candidatus Paceibacteria bacterium]|jgi:putative Mg2+ transporter-C (MgtC) family protein
MNEYDLILRLVVALFLGALIGVERVHAGKSAGIRTLGLVALGSALFIVISESVIAGYGFEIDPLRVAANIVTGVGFLGAGMIIVKGDGLSNLTTAAGVWVAAAIGMAAGFGMYGIAVAVTTLVIVTFTLMWNVENYLKEKFGTEKK